MAEFSKQFAQANNFDRSDFDIEQLETQFNEENDYIQQICEGYGFVGIAKDSKGQTVALYVREDEHVKITFIPVHLLQILYENKKLPHQLQGDEIIGEDDCAPDARWAFERDLFKLTQFTMQQIQEQGTDVSEDILDAQVVFSCFCLHFSADYPYYTLKYNWQG